MWVRTAIPVLALPTDEESRTPRELSLYEVTVNWNAAPSYLSPWRSFDLTDSMLGSEVGCACGPLLRGRHWPAPPPGRCRTLHAMRP